MLKWIDNAVFYEIYPTSFYDSNGDGIGDLKGIAEKADYIKSLGVDAVWFNPFYKSPFKDGGYDITDYYQIDRRFGTMEDFDNMVKVFKEKGIKIVLDLVIGHTSDKHKWFKKSTLAKRNEFYDYYVWTDDVNTSSPGVIRGLYYRNGGYVPNYYASQPALNFGFNQLDEKAPWKMHYMDERLRPLREEVLNIMRFYLDKGVDGFRVDMAGHLVKEGATFDYAKYFDDYDEKTEGIIWLWGEILGTLRKEYEDKVFIAEWIIPQLSIAKCGFDIDFLHHDTLSFNDLYRNEAGLNLSPYYERGDNYFSPNGRGTLSNFVEYVEFLYNKLGASGMFTAPTGTHDEVRMPTKKSPDLIKCIFAFLLTLKQIPLIYYGDEIGMEHNYLVSKDGGGIRTGARTPMQWTSGKNRGFSTKNKTYLPTSKTKGQSVQEQENDGNSILNTVRRLIKIRKEFPALNATSEQRFIEKGYPAVYERTDGDKTILILINPSNNVIEKAVKYTNVIYSQNTQFDGAKITLNNQSFAILLK